MAGEPPPAPPHTDQPSPFLKNFFKYFDSSATNPEARQSPAQTAAQSVAHSDPQSIQKNKPPKMEDVYRTVSITDVAFWDFSPGSLKRGGSRPQGANGAGIWSFFNKPQESPKS